MSKNFPLCDPHKDLMMSWLRTNWPFANTLKYIMKELKLDF